MKYLIWLQLVMNYGNARVHRVFEQFGNAKAVFFADYNTKAACGLFTKAELSRMKSVSITKAEKILKRCGESKIVPIGIDDEKYPECLFSIDNPPLVLYTKGHFPDFDNTPSICIVGPRKVSEFGKKAAFSLAARLSRAGFTVVSGGAMGSDKYVHSGVLKYDGVTVLVMGCGINSDYLSENARLREAVTKKGCLISEYPPDAPATGYNFPIRNRIMSALCCGTIVIEGDNKSGALITAKHANEQGRDVFVIPGSPDKHEYEGSNALLRDGAKPLLDTSDIFNEYIVRFPDKINIEKAFEKTAENDNKKINKNLLLEGLSKEAKIVYNQLDSPKFYPDNIKNTGLTAEELISALTELEIAFIIKALPGGQYEVADR